MPETPRVSIVIPTYNGREMLRACLVSLREQDFTGFETIVVDNASRDGTLSMLREEFAEVRVRQMESNAGFAKAVNAGIHESRGEFIALLNNDAKPESGWLAALVDRADGAADEDAWASVMLWAHEPYHVDTAGHSLRPDGTPVCLWKDEAASSLPTGPVEILGPCAGAGMYRRKLFEDVGLFDGSFFLYCEDVDLALRARLAGHRTSLVPAARVLHAHMGTSSRIKNVATYCQYRNTVLYLIKNMPLWWLALRLPRLALSGMVPLITRPWRAEGWMYVLAKLALPLHLPVALLKRVRARKLRRTPIREISGLLVSAPAPAMVPDGVGGVNGR